MSDITLTASVRSNLSTLQSTAALIGQTQERLASGKKVNSALDNPNSFFTASNLNSRASDLSNLQDDIGQSVSTLEAADKGIKAIDKLLDAAKGKANQALQTKDTDTRAKYAAEYNELLTQIEDAAKDSGYKGKNLLGGDGNDLKVKFNEDGSSDLNIKAVDYTDLDSEDSSFKLESIGASVKSQEEVAFDNNIVELGLGAEKFKGTISIAAVNSRTDSLVGVESLASGDDLTINVNGDSHVFKIGTDGDTIEDLARYLSDIDGVSASASLDGNLKISSDSAITLTPPTGKGASFSGAAIDAGTLVGGTVLSSLDGFADGDAITYKAENGEERSFKIEGGKTVDQLAAALRSAGNVETLVAGNRLQIDANDVDLQIGFRQGSDNSTTGAELGTGKGVTVNKDTQAQAQRDGSGWGDDSLIEASLDQVRQAQLDLRAQASTFGTNMTVVTNRQNFTADMINTLQTGAGKLTLADTNLEGANLSALNTQNQIATSTLALATQANQSVLQLIR